LFTQISPVREPLLQAFPFPSTLGKVTLHQLSQACVFIYSSCGRWVLPPLLCSFPPTATFTSFPAPAYWAVLLLLPAAMFVYSSRGKWVFPPLTSFPSPGCWARVPAPARASPARPACLFTAPGRIPFPQSLALSAPHPLSRVFLLFLLLITQFLFFFPCGGQSVRGAMLLWPRLVCGGTAVPRSSPGLRLPKPSGCGRLAAPGPLLGSPFNVKWRCSAPAGDVERSKLCLFSVIMPAKCVSSVSPRFHYRRLTFCFLPLAAILESLYLTVLNVSLSE
jgi:hypothetical protein